MTVSWFPSILGLKQVQIFSNNIKRDEIYFYNAFKHVLGKNMELLELEMRARAIKSLLNVEKDPDVDKPETDQAEVDKPEPDHSEMDKAEKETLEIKKAEENDKVLTEAEIEKRKKESEEKEMMRKAAEEEKKLQKARQALMSSEAKKREEEEALERKHAEIR